MKQKDKKIIKATSHFRLLSLAFLLPPLTVVCLFGLWSSELKENAQLITTQSMFPLAAFILSTLFSFFLLYFLLRGIDMINNKITHIVPLFKLSSYYIEPKTNTRGISHVFSGILNTIDALSVYIKDINQEKVGISDSKFKIEMDSIYDSLLSNIFNRRHTEELLKKSIKELNPAKGLAVAILDIDHFKEINDQYGHDCGDFVLKEIVSLIPSCLRNEDILGRWGGEEFCILTVIDNATIANKIYERVRKRIEGTTLIYIAKEGKHIPIKRTISIGFTFYHHQENTSMEQIVKRADEALYHSKNSGRNMVTVFNL
ncbi:MAG: GGDEF domain-containing protein [Candidatus Omnitrophica bacterium]|nr:GGDEF domain-containing protein [Candidatus Omnitrophota bacterium]